MTVPAPIIALVRSLVQAGIGVLMSAPWFVPLLEWINENMGLDLDEVVLESAAFTVAFGLVVIVTNWLGKNEQFQWLNKVISLFLSNSAAVYEKTQLAGGDGVPDVEVDTGGEDMGLEHGAVTVGVLLAIVAGACAVAFFLTQGAVWLAVGLLCLAVAILAGGHTIG